MRSIVLVKLDDYRALVFLGIEPMQPATTIHPCSKYTAADIWFGFSYQMVPVVQ